MKVSKSQLINGVFNFLTNEVVKQTPDQSMKVLMGFAVLMLRNNPNTLEKYIFQNPIIQMFLVEDNGYYEVDSIISALKASMNEYGELEIIIPPIPLVSKEQKKLSFSTYDVDKLKEHIERCCQ